MPTKTKTPVQKTPPASKCESWAVDAWPTHIYPGDSSKARYVIRRNFDALASYGALIRVGRRIVVLAEGYSAWLRSQRGNLDNDVMPSTIEAARAQAVAARKAAAAGEGAGA